MGASRFIEVSSYLSYSSALRRSNSSMLSKPLVNIRSSLCFNSFYYFYNRASFIRASYIYFTTALAVALSISSYVFVNSSSLSSFFISLLSFP
jgi:hypothetical protein